MAGTTHVRVRVRERVLKCYLSSKHTVKHSELGAREARGFATQDDVVIYIVIRY